MYIGPRIAYLGLGLVLSRVSDRVRLDVSQPTEAEYQQDGADLDWHQEQSGTNTAWQCVTDTRK